MKFEDPLKDVVPSCVENGSRFFCEYCKKGFSRKNNLKAHMTSHGFYKRPVKCEFCDKLFSKASNLQVHIKGTHSHRLQVCKRNNNCLFFCLTSPSIEIKYTKTE